MFWWLSCQKDRFKVAGTLVVEANQSQNISIGVVVVVVGVALAG